MEFMMKMLEIVFLAILWLALLLIALSLFPAYGWWPTIIWAIGLIAQTIKEIR